MGIAERIKGMKEEEILKLMGDPEAMRMVVDGLQMEEWLKVKRSLEEGNIAEATMGTSMFLKTLLLCLTQGDEKRLREAFQLLEQITFSEAVLAREVLRGMKGGRDG